MWTGRFSFNWLKTMTTYFITGGFGFRYEIARRYGIHMGLDIAFAPDNAAVYVQIGSAWARP